MTSKFEIEARDYLDKLRRSLFVADIPGAPNKQ